MSQHDSILMACVVVDGVEIDFDEIRNGCGLMIRCWLYFENRLLS